MEYRRIANITEGHRFLNLSVLDADGLEHSFHWPNELAPDIPGLARRRGLGASA